MKTVTIETLLNGLLEIPAEDFVIGTVCDFLRANPVKSDSLVPYLFFSQTCYTRNLIFKNELFEMMTLCWENGQATPIHDHANQNCWMAMPQGKLRVINFRTAEIVAGKNLCRVEQTEQLDIEESCAAEVDPAEPIHQILNLPEFGDRAVSLHIYSRPFTSCQIYSTSLNEVRTRQLCYYSIDGRLCDNTRA
ncbi:MAG: cysteine dioxygenase family protein [Pyrinomonadaceae bacterium]